MWIGLGRRGLNLACSPNRERKSRDLVLTVESTGDLGWFDACVKKRVIFCFWCAHTYNQMV